MENNKHYLQKLPVVALIAVASVLVQVFFLNPPIAELENKSRVIYIVIEGVLYHGVLFLSLGIVLQKWREAGIAFAVGVGLILAEYFAFRSNEATSNDHAARNFFLVQLFYLLPHLVFFIAGRFPLKKIAFIFLAIIIYRGTSAAYNAPAGIFTILKIFGPNLEAYDKYLNAFVFIAMDIASVVFYCELQHFAMQKDIKWRPKLLNPGNEYPKGGATVLFFTFKTALAAMAIGIGFQLGNLHYFLGYGQNSPFKFYFYNDMVNAVFAIPVVIFGAFYLRKFLLEYAVSHSAPSKFLYWLFILPVIGSVAWLVSLNNKSNTGFGSKAAAINEYAGSSPQGVTLLNILLMCFPLIKAMSNGAGAGIAAVFISIAFFIWFISDRSGYYFNMYLSLAVMIILAIMIPGTKKEYELYELATYYGLLLFNISQLILIYPVYHFQDFSYIDNEEAVTDDHDLLAEFNS